MRIGVFVGAFDPIHNGHIKTVNSLLNEKILDNIYVVPASNYYNRKGLTQVEQRIMMCKVAFPDYQNIIVPDKRFCTEKVDLYQVLCGIREYYTKNDEIYCVIGSDMLYDFESNHNAGEILTDYKLIVVNRDGENLEKLVGANFFLQSHIKNIFNYSCNVPNISSTQIRTQLYKKKPIDGLTSKEVIKHINRYKLFK